MTRNTSNRAPAGTWVFVCGPSGAGKDSVIGWARGQLADRPGIVFAQRPKLSPHKRALAERIAEILRVSPEAVSVKAKTGESVGEVGREEVMMAQCVALLAPRTSA